MYTHKKEKERKLREGFPVFHATSKRKSGKTVKERKRQSKDGFGQEFCESSRVRVHGMRVEPSQVRDCELQIESSCKLSSRVVEFNR